MHNGDIRSIEESDEYKDAVNRNADYLSTRLLSLSSKRRLAVMNKALDKMELGEQDDFLSQLLVSRFDCAGQNGQQKLQDILDRLISVQLTYPDDDDGNYDDVETELSVIGHSTDPLRLVFESNQQDDTAEDSGDDNDDVVIGEEDDEERSFAGTSIGRLTELLKHNAGDEDGDDAHEEGIPAALGESNWLTEMKRKLSSDSSTDHSEARSGTHHAQQSDDDNGSEYEAEPQQAPTIVGDLRRSKRQRKVTEKLRRSS